MSKATQKIGTGVKAIGAGLKMVGGTDVPTYTLQFLTPSEKHPVHSSQTIVVPYAELGRDGNCLVQFGKDTPMVSSKHAAIEQRGPETILKQLSQTNQTFINGRPVLQEWFLTDGDEIQLSATGPRLRYVNSTAKTSGIGLSKRIQLFARQSLRPYRRALITLLVLFVAGAAGAAYLVVTLRTDNRQLQRAYQAIDQQTKAQQEAIQKGDSLFVAGRRETANKLAAANRENGALQRELTGLKQALEKSRKTPPSPATAQPVVIPANAGELLPKMIEQVRRHVYFLKMYLTVEGEIERTYVGSGTGFLLSDGRFITARHCVQPWAYTKLEAKEKPDEMWLMVNWLYYNRPKEAIKLELELTSPENKSIVLPAEKFVVSDGQDLYYTGIDVGLGPGKIQLASLEDGTDWAFCSVDTKSAVGIPADPAEATQLKTGTVVHILGYTFGLGNSGEAPSPFYSTANVSQTGLINGLINVTNLGFAQANSGGPVFVEKDGKLVNVGLVSAGNAELGLVVPINAIK